MDLAGRVSLVTGSARRLGRELALALAGRGSKVAVHFHTSKEEAEDLVERIRREGGEAHSFGANLLQSSSSTDLIEAVTAHFGGIHVLVNNASSFYPTTLGETSEEQWDDLLGVNLKAPFFCSQAAGLAMKRQGEGRIVNLADVAVLRPWPGYIPYSVSKAGLVALTRGMARALAPEVRVNAVAPGTILPPEGSTQEEMEGWKKGTLLGRIGTPADLIGAVLFLLERGDYITGEVLLLDGGRHLT